MTELTPQEFTSERIELIKRTFAKGASDDELALFVATAQRLGLDPTARQIHLVKRWDAAERRETMSIQVGIDGYRLVADRTGRYAPGPEPAYTYDQDGKLYAATAYVKKLVGGEWHLVADTALYDEYVQTKKDGEPNAMWRKMPHSQLAKCAEARALRRAFPAELSGVYTSDEMGQADNERQQGQMVARQQHALPAPENNAQARRARMLARLEELAAGVSRETLEAEWSTMFDAGHPDTHAHALSDEDLTAWGKRLNQLTTTTDTTTEAE
jgi:phage recombination protein Bet